MSGFDGTLLRFGESSEGTAFPTKYVYKDSYQCYVNVQDLDSNRTTKGKLKRNVLSHAATTITFTTRPMWNDEFDEMMSAIRSNYTGSTTEKGFNLERKIKLYYFCPETNSHLSGTFYLTTPQPTIMQISGTKIRYAEMTLEFIEY